MATAKITDTDTGTAKLQAGWGWPDSQGNVHYFAEGKVRSLCGKVSFTAERTEQRDWASSDSCADCRARFKDRQP